MQTSDFQRERSDKTKKLFKLSNNIGLCCILFFVFSLIISYSITYLTRDLNAYYSEQTAQDFRINLSYILGTIIPIPLSFLIFAKINKMKISESLPLNFTSGKKIALAISASFGAMIVLRFIVVLLLLIFEIFFRGIKLPELTQTNETGGVVVMTVVVTLMTGLIEEFAFRGLMLTALRKYGDTFAVIVSSAIFGMMHANLIQGISAFMIGIVMAYAVIATNSLWTSIIIHTFNNFQAMSLLIFPTQTAMIFNLITTLLMMVLGITAFVILIVYRKKTKAELNLQKEKVLPLKNRILSVVAAPTIILLTALIIFLTPIKNFLTHILLS